ncbi:uncharacterized protein LOC109534899 isoform X2 [Dendroctonus ponderosae]|uniref:uncharacterized protein LOC109534899 isoform X2 n=1 Tax=Dendroctonus ponderosae TaxID=77166 RepID=UPI002035B9AC|nr:uncharacterized protein LOC109534899 isoform X2 [Dendroctonus ponderosae]
MTVNSQSGPPKSPRPPDDLIATAASALRRLHFKTGRNATKTSSKPQPSQPVPKVIVMGSSTASEATINTSTDSSNTIVTTVTATDGELTEGSLDTAEQVDYFSSENILDARSIAVLQPIPASPKTPATARQVTPPACRNQTKFTFDDVESSKGEKTPKAIALIHSQQFNFETAAIPMETEPTPPLEEKTMEKLMDEHINKIKTDALRRNSHKQSTQNYEQLDIESDSKLYNRGKRNSDVGGVMSDSKLNSQRQRENRRSFRRKLDVKEEKTERTSPKRRVERGPSSSPENETESPRPKQRHKKAARRNTSTGSTKSRTTEKFVYDQKHVAKFRTNPGTSQSHVTPPLPDLRVDFFNESLDRRRSSILDSLTTPTLGAALEKRGSVCLNKCLREVGAQLDASNPSATSPINVTTNPLENPLHFGRKAPQATIVVQQASLSLDHANITSTILLKNGNDFLGNVHTVQEANAAKLAALKSQKEENMKQLLDVANNLTLEEIHDFEMRYGSPHHNRSQSVKTPGRSSGRPNYLCLPQQRSRVASMPNTGVEEEYYRLRHFSITGKGIVNRGDSLKSRRSRSNNSVASSNSSTEQLPGPTSAAGSARTSASCSLASSRESSTSAPGPTPFRVLMLGGPAVGKSSLVSQFMTSEYLHAYDTSIDDESGEKSVSVLLAGEESELTFIDFATMDLSPDSLIKKYNDPHAYAVVYSCADRASFDCAEKILQNLWTLDTIGTKAVILVSNKADLVRSRMVTTEGKSMATAYDCKYIETSVGINHNVDELLVGILTQIRLKLENPERSRDLFRKRSSSKKNLHRNRSPASGAATPTTGSAQNSPKKYRGSRTSASLKVRSLLGKVWARDSKSKSCENLHVL